MKDKTKTMLFISSAIILCTCFTSITHAEPTVMVTSYSLDPGILFPGDTAELTVTLTNTEITGTKTDTDYINGLPVDQKIDTIAATLDKVWITDDGDGTNLIRSEKSFNNIGDLSPGSSLTLSFQITADENISEGQYHPIIRVDVEDYQDVKYPIPIRIDNRSVSLLPDDAPSKISIGGTTDISFNVVNNRMDSVEGITLTSNNNNELEFNPNSIFIGSLESGESKEVTISLHPNELGKKKLSLILSYFNANNPHSHTYNSNIEIIEVLDVAPILYSVPTTIEKGQSTRISLEVYNAKTETITGVIVKPITEATIIPTQYYIGSMDADDVFSATFDLYTDEIDYGNHTMDFQVSFKQGNEIYETPAISSSFTVVPMDDSSVNRGFILPVGIIASAVVSVVLFFEYKKRRRNGK